MTAGQTFDFASHLHHQTLVEWEIEELVGGVSNHTARVRPYRSSNDTKEGSGSYYDVLKPHKSVILKQAPAYLAKAPDIPFSPYRQVSPIIVVHHRLLIIGASSRQSKPLLSGCSINLSVNTRLDCAKSL